jgi:hypothetical protein
MLSKYYVAKALRRKRKNIKNDENKKLRKKGRKKKRKKRERKREANKIKNKK